MLATNALNHKWPLSNVFRCSGATLRLTFGAVGHRLKLGASSFYHHCSTGFTIRQPSGDCLCCCADHGELNMAPTGSLLVITILQVLVVSGRQSADQPPKLEPAAGVAVSVTVEPKTKLPVHPAPETQSIPSGTLVTVPFPQANSENRQKG